MKLLDFNKSSENILVAEDKIGGKIVRCIFDLSKYSEEKFEAEFQEFVGLQSKQISIAEPVFYPLYHLKSYPHISYEYFKEYSLKLFSTSFFYMLKQNPQFILGDELNLYFFIVKVKHSFEQVPELTNLTHSVFYVKGLWLLNHFVAPYQYLGKISPTIVKRFFLHELTHFVDLIEGNLSWDWGKWHETKIVRRYGSINAWGIVCLYNSLFNLREEGFADFIMRADSPNIDINGDALREYNSLLKKLAFIREKEEAKDFYDVKISSDNATLTGEYAIGRVMCLFIALAIAKKKKKSYYISLKNDERYFYEHEQLDKWISSGKTFYVKGIPKEVITEAIELIRPATQYSFVKLYENACKELGISDKNLAMTRARFLKLVNNANKDARNDAAKEFEKRALPYIDSDDDHINHFI